MVNRRKRILDAHKSEIFFKPSAGKKRYSYREKCTFAATSMANSLADRFVGRYLLGCTLRGNESDCAKLDLIIAILAIRKRLEDLIPPPQIIPPEIGPDPAPFSDRLRELIDADPDGAPARFYSDKIHKNNLERLKLAKKLRDSLKTILDDLDKNIKELSAN